MCAQISSSKILHDMLYLLLGVEFCFTCLESFIYYFLYDKAKKIVQMNQTLRPFFIEFIGKFQ